MPQPSNRPAIGGQVTRKTEEKRKAALDEGLRLVIDGEAFEVRMGDVTSKIARELRRETGHGVYGLIEAVASQPDVDLVAEFVWLARRLRGEVVELDDVEVTYADLLGDDFEVDTAGAVEGDEGPEA